MSDYNKVKIESTWLTRDGTEDELPCLVTVTGLDRLKLSKTGAVQLAADGTPRPFVTPNLGKGVTIVITIFTIAKDIFDDIIADINTALNASDTVNITLEGDTGDFDLDCFPLLPTGIEFPGDFSDDRVHDVKLSFVVSEVNT